MRLSEWDRLAAIVDPTAYIDGLNELDLEMAERRSQAREKVRLIENALVAMGWTTNTKPRAQETRRER